MIIRNDANSHYFFVLRNRGPLLPDGKTEARALIAVANVHHTFLISHFITDKKSDLHKIYNVYSKRSGSM